MNYPDDKYLYLHAAGVKQLPSNERVSFEKRRGHGGH